MTRDARRASSSVKVPTPGPISNTTASPVMAAAVNNLVTNVAVNQEFLP